MVDVDKGFLEDMTSYCLKHAYHKMMIHAEEQLSQFDLKVPQFSILAVVHLNPGITQSKLIDNLYVTRSTASELIEKLVNRNLVVREPINRKSSGLVLSAEGEKLFDDALKNAKESELGLEKTLSKEEIDQLNSLLLKLANSYK